LEKEKYFLFDTACAVVRGFGISYQMNDTDYSLLWNEAKKRNMTLLLAEGMKELYLPEKLATDAKNRAEKSKKSYALFVLFQNELAKKGVKSLILGGAAYRTLYSEPLWRECRDFDILIKPQDIKKACEAAENAGFSVVRESEYCTFFYRSPGARVAVYSEYYNLHLLSKAVNPDDMILKISPEDRYISSLYVLKKNVDAGRGEAKRLLDIFVLKLACEVNFDYNYVNAKLEKNGLVGFEAKITEIYNSVFLKKNTPFDKELFDKFFSSYSKKLPPKYVSPQKQKVLNRMKWILFSSAAALIIASVVSLLIIFNNDYTSAKPEITEESEGLESSSEEFSQSENYGRVEYSDSVYTGEITDGIPNGKGKIEYYSGDVYEGDVSMGIKNGIGTYTYFTGDKYEGNFVNDIMTGKGTFYYSNGDIVSGDFVDGIPNGVCKVLYYDKESSDYAEYNGDIVNGVRNGNGKITYISGDTFEGVFENGDRINGKYTWKNGDIYSGLFENGKPSGGIMYFANGDRYEGEFAGGIIEGSGVYTFADGSVYKGKFKNGKQNDSSATYIEKNGVKYVGAFVDGIKSGIGTVYYTNGDRVSGNFVNGKLEGSAKYYYKEFDMTATVKYKNGVPVD